jgi:uncharacterized protein involved in exopolysaccharide biosynthesis
MLTLLAAAAFTLLQPKLYRSSTSLVLTFKEDNPFERVGIPAQLSSSYIATQLDIIRSQRVALQVVDMLGLENDPERRENFLAVSGGEGSIRNWIAYDLMKNLRVEPQRDSRVVNISYESTDPKVAALTADAFAKAYIDTTLELSMEPARRNAAWFDEQLKDLRERLDSAQARLTEFQQEKGIIALDERLDTETSRLNNLSKSYVDAQEATFDVQSRQLGRNHPEYRRAVERESSLRSSLEQQKNRILELKKQRDELEALARDVEVEQQSYEATLQSFYRTRLESQFNQTNIAILSPAVPPKSPFSPNVVLNMLSALFLGVILSIVLALISELSNRRILMEDDIPDLLDTRVLTTV